MLSTGACPRAGYGRRDRGRPIDYHRSQHLSRRKPGPPRRLPLVVNKAAARGRSEENARAPGVSWRSFQDPLSQCTRRKTNSRRDSVIESNCHHGAISGSVFKFDRLFANSTGCWWVGGCDRPTPTPMDYHVYTQGLSSWGVRGQQTLI